MTIARHAYCPGATVEVLAEPNFYDKDIIEPGPYGLRWVRRAIYSVSPWREGVHVTFEGTGATGWYPRDNVRNLTLSVAS